MARKRKTNLPVQEERKAWQIAEARILFLEEALECMDDKTVQMARTKLIDALRLHKVLYDKRMPAGQ